MDVSRSQPLLLRSVAVPDAVLPAAGIVQGAYDDVTAAVGDVLSFSYTAGYHDVMLIQEGNDECDFSGGSLLDETGSFQFTLTEPGEFIFACTKGCLLYTSPSPRDRG